ncbi:helix-turn-helix domain-containing protein [Pelosinus baikalensis]|uniref:Helix-turn-helix transcriptional regulator n=1 Tax=Pelosinus baikalensis TaxID=2892015 RepID=A0ABS8HYD6_9FIRM|nr:helix-turn-helix transcriptional regulator [Pelosinus baikalensis]MCC5468184.1 helix-turn-helix transcriptional regulator [Pelosinus baikalensis]
MNFSSRLKALRQRNKVSQQELADLLGISTRAWRFYESGDREPNLTGLIALADFFNVSLDYLVGRSDDTNKR